MLIKDKEEEMKGHLFLKPAVKGMIIRDPITKTVLPDKGSYKPIVGIEGKYWNRRILDQSVIIAESAVEESEKPIIKDLKLQFGNKYKGGKK